MRRVPHLLALLALLGAAGLTGCAAAGRSQPPTHAEEPGTRPGDAYKSSEGPEPETIAGWEARIQRHGAALFNTVHTGGVGGGGGGSTTSGGTTPPVAPPPTGPGPSPGTAPARRPTAARPTVRRLHATRATRATPYRASIRCRRICRHVRAICYAAQRICQIAARVGGASAQAACARNRKRCTSARATTIRQGCTGCGHARRTKKSNLCRRACLR